MQVAQRGQFRGNRVLGTRGYHAGFAYVRVRLPRGAVVWLPWLSCGCRTGRQDRTGYRTAASCLVFLVLSIQGGTFVKLDFDSQVRY